MKDRIPHDHLYGLLLTGISRERIHVELRKLLCGVRAGEILREYSDVFAVILPALNAARAKARAISCLSNMKQMGLAIAGYYNGTYFTDYATCTVSVTGTGTVVPGGTSGTGGACAGTPLVASVSSINL